MTTAGTVEINPVDVARIRGKLASPRMIEEPVNELIFAAAAFAAVDMRSEGRDLGAIGRSIVAEPVGFTARIGSTNSGALPLDEGRHSSKQPPVEALKNWAEAHGLGGLEFVIARAIARRGIKGRFFAERTKDRLREIELPRLIAEAEAKIALFWNGL